jgi:hypothetical protein
MVGCPAKGISAVGKKMRTLAVWAGSSGVWTKIVSLRLNCRAMVCICAVAQPVGILHDGQRIAGEGRCGEDIVDVKWQHGGDLLGSRGGEHAGRALARGRAMRIFDRSDDGSNN